VVTVACLSTKAASTSSRRTIDIGGVVLSAWERRSSVSPPSERLRTQMSYPSSPARHSAMESTQKAAAWGAHHRMGGSSSLMGEGTCQSGDEGRLAAARRAVHEIAATVRYASVNVPDRRALAGCVAVAGRAPVRQGIALASRRRLPRVWRARAPLRRVDEIANIRRDVLSDAVVEDDRVQWAPSAGRAERAPLRAPIGVDRRGLLLWEEGGGREGGRHLTCSRPLRGRTCFAEANSCASSRNVSKRERLRPKAVSFTASHGWPVCKSTVAYARGGGEGEQEVVMNTGQPGWEADVGEDSGVGGSRLRHPVASARIRLSEAVLCGTCSRVRSTISSWPR
jgi:hypothetical protein